PPRHPRPLHSFPTRRSSDLRQAVPLIRAEAPLVGTGMEETVARDSGVTIIAHRSGVVDQVDATRIVVRATEETSAAASGVDIYKDRKSTRLNSSHVKISYAV